jgi:organic radical activating enzyme
MLFNKKDIQVLQIEPTADCNAKCPQCPRYDQDQVNPFLPSNELTIERIQEKIDLEFVKNLKKVFMCGNFGEPAMAQNTLEIFQWFREQNSEITLGMNTNGSVRSAAWWSSLGTLFNQTNDYVVFSIDGLEDTNEIYRRNTAWHRIIENAQAFIDAGGSAHWDMLVFEHNQHQVDQCIELARQMGFKWLRYKVSKRFQSRPVTWLNPPQGYISVAEKKSTVIHCDSLSNRVVYMDSNGTLFPCCYISDALYQAQNSPVKQQTQQLLNFDQRYQQLSMNQLLDQHHWDSISNTWNTEPAKVCQNNCSLRENNITVSRNQWVKEIEL